MEQESDKRHGPTARDVIKSGSFRAPMAQWVTLAAAVSKPRYDEHMAAFEEWIDGEFKRLKVQPGNYDELVRMLRPHGLTRKKNESAKDFCRRVLLVRRRATNKSLEQAFRRPGRRARPLGSGK